MLKWHRTSGGEQSHENHNQFYNLNSIIVKDITTATTFKKNCQTNLDK